MQAQNWARGSSLLSAALELWRGQPLGDPPDRLAFADAAACWSRQRLQGVRWRMEADLHLGRHAELLTELANLTERILHADPVLPGSSSQHINMVTLSLGPAKGRARHGAREHQQRDGQGGGSGQRFSPMWTFGQQGGSGALVPTAGKQHLDRMLCQDRGEAAIAGPPGF